MLPGFDATPLKREFRELVTRALSISPFALTLLDDTSSSQARNTLGLGAGADIASAATLDLTGSPGNVVLISGIIATSAITMNRGVMYCIADGAWPLTYNATTNPVQGGASYTCAAGDIVVYIKDIDDVLHNILIRKDGQPVTPVETAGIDDAAVTQEKLAQPLTSGTVQSASSGTEVAFSGIPSWAVAFDLVFSEVSLSGTDNFLVQLGDAGGIENSGYTSDASLGGVAANATSGFVIRSLAAANTHSGTVRFRKVTGNKWVCDGMVRPNTTATDGSTAGFKTLSNTLTQLKIICTGSNSFDGANGQFQIYYWGAAS